MIPYGLFYVFTRMSIDCTKCRFFQICWIIQTESPTPLNIFPVIEIISSLNIIFMKFRWELDWLPLISKSVSHFLVVVLFDEIWGVKFFFLWQCNGSGVSHHISVIQYFPLKLWHGFGDTYFLIQINQMLLFPGFPQHKTTIFIGQTTY